MNYDDEIKKKDEILFAEMMDLMNIPLMKKIMVHKFEELKILLSSDIENYKQITKLLRPSTAARFPGSVEIQLKRLGKKLWIPSKTSIGEQEKKMTSQEMIELFPQQLIDFIVSKIPTAGEIVEKTGFSVSTLPHRVFDFNFKRISEQLISGVFFEQKANPSNLVFFQREPTFMDNTVDMDLLSNLFQYLLMNKIMYKHVVLQFIFVWKQLIDEQH